MKYTIAILVLAAVVQASSRSKQGTEDAKTEKRALLEGNAGVQKRAPLLPTALPPVNPGIEYADSKDLEEEKSPQQQLYATAVPQLAKISDVLTGQGPPFQAAIASHLFSPISIYQPRLSSPTYEVSPPVASQLAYAEKITYQPSPQQFNPQVFKPQRTNVKFLQPVQQYPTAPQNLIAPQLPLQPQIYSQPQFLQIPQQQLFFNPQLQYQQQQVPQQQLVQQLLPQQQLIQKQIPQQQLVQQRISQQQLIPQHQQFQQQIPQPQLYQQQIPQQQLLQQQIIQQPGIVYAREDDQKTNQGELKTSQTQAVQPLHNSQERTAQNYNSQNQGAVSFASFSVGPPAQYRQEQNPAQNQAQYQREQDQARYPNDQYNQQNEAQNQAPQQFQPQIQQYQTQNTPTQPQVRQYEIQRQPLPQISTYQSYQYQPQSQIQIQPQVIQKIESSPANSIPVPAKIPLNSGKEEYRPNPVLYRPQLYQAQNFVAPNPYGNQALAAPTFPPVQFFGKFAHTLFKQYQQQ